MYVLQIHSVHANAGDSISTLLEHSAALPTEYGFLLKIWCGSDSFLFTPFVWSVLHLVWFFRDPKMANLLTGPGTQQHPL